jgi:hypothetical protein
MPAVKGCADPACVTDRRLSLKMPGLTTYRAFPWDLNAAVWGLSEQNSGDDGYSGPRQPIPAGTLTPLRLTGGSPTAPVLNVQLEETNPGVIRKDGTTACLQVFPAKKQNGSSGTDFTEIQWSRWSPWQGTVNWDSRLAIRVKEHSAHHPCCLSRGHHGGGVSWGTIGELVKDSLGWLSLPYSIILN